MRVNVFHGFEQVIHLRQVADEDLRAGVSQRLSPMIIRSHEGPHRIALVQQLQGGGVAGLSRRGGHEDSGFRGHGVIPSLGCCP